MKEPTNVAVLAPRPSQGKVGSNISTDIFYFHSDAFPNKSIESSGTDGTPSCIQMHSQMEQSIESSLARRKHHSIMLYSAVRFKFFVSSDIFDHGIHICDQNEPLLCLLLYSVLSAFFTIFRRSYKFCTLFFLYY